MKEEVVCMPHGYYRNGNQVSKHWNAVFDALRSEPRRTLLIALADESPDQPVHLPEGAIRSAVSRDPAQMQVELEHVHLPLLADKDFIEWEREPFVAVRGENFTHVEVVLASIFSQAHMLPDSLVSGCQPLEQARRSP